MFSGLGLTAKAAELGTTASNSIKMVENKTYTKYWTNDNCDLNCFNKIVVSSRGVITFEIKKPLDYEGEYGSFTLKLYNSNNSLAWQGETSPMKNDISDTYKMKIGVAAGTYYLNIVPDFYIPSYSAPIKSAYKYSFTATNYWEIEPNDSTSQATKINLNKTYSGVYCEESYDTNYEDWFKVSLVKGKEYKIRIGNYAELDKGTMIFDMFNPYGQEEDASFYFAKYDEKGAYIFFTPSMSGEFKIRFYNDGYSAPVEYQISVSETTKTNGTLIKQNSAWYYTENGKKVKTTTLCKYNGAWYYVKNGKVDFNATTLFKFNDEWYYVKYGKVDFKATTLVKYNGVWYYVKNGKVNKDNTIVKYNSAWYHVNGGKTVKDTTLVKYNGTWYYVKSGKVDFNSTTLCKYNSKWYYVQKGKVNFKANTKVKYNGKWYSVRNGVVV